MEVVIEGITNKPSTRKPLLGFSDLFYVKHRTSFHRLSGAHTKCKAIRKGNVLCYTIKNQKGYTKINTSVKQALYDCIIQHS